MKNHMKTNMENEKDIAARRASFAATQASDVKSGSLQHCAVKQHSTWGLRFRVTL